MKHLSKRSPMMLAALTATAALALAGCSPANEQDSEATTAESSQSTSAAESTTEVADSELTFEEAVVRAKGEDNHMTGIFGTLVNHTDRDLSITGFTTSLGAPKNQMHETVDGVMQEMTTPMTIPANGERVLEPGGDHLMVMDYETPVAAGDTVDITFELADGATVEAKDVPVRTLLPGDEDYGDLAGQEHGGLEGMEDMEDMDHSGHEGMEGMDHGDSGNMEGMDHSGHEGHEGH